jgi:hypothetical protein
MTRSCSAAGRAQWADLTEFEILPVLGSAEAARRANVRWDASGH